MKIRSLISSLLWSLALAPALGCEAKCKVGDVLTTCAAPPAGPDLALMEMTRPVRAQLLTNTRAHDLVWLAGGRFNDMTGTLPRNVGCLNAAGQWSFFHVNAKDVKVDAVINDAIPVPVRPLRVTSTELDGDGRVVIVTIEDSMDGPLINTAWLNGDALIPAHGWLSVADLTAPVQLLQASVGRSYGGDGGAASASGFIAWAGAASQKFYFLHKSPRGQLGSSIFNFGASSQGYKGVLAQDLDGDGRPEPILVQEQQLVAFVTERMSTSFNSLDLGLKTGEVILYAATLTATNGRPLVGVISQLGTTRTAASYVGMGGARFARVQTQVLPDALQEPWLFTDLGSDDVLDLVATEARGQDFQLSQLVLGPQPPTRVRLELTDAEDGSKVVLTGPKRLAAAHTDADPGPELLVGDDGPKFSALYHLKLQ